MRTILIHIIYLICPQYIGSPSSTAYRCYPVSESVGRVRGALKLKSVLTSLVTIRSPSFDLAASRATATASTDDAQGKSAPGVTHE